MGGTISRIIWNGMDAIARRCEWLMSKYQNQIGYLTKICHLM